MLFTNFKKLMLAFALVTSSTVFAGDFGVGNGGDYLRSQIVLNYGQKVISTLSRYGRELLREHNIRLSDLSEVLNVDRIKVVDKELVDNTGSIVDALYNRIDKRLYLNVHAWDKIIERGQNINYLIFHEMLRMLEVNDDNYRISKEYLKIEKGIAFGENEELDKTLLQEVSRGSVDTVRELLFRGANPNARWDNGNTALISSIQVRTNTDIAELLIKYGADLNSLGADGFTPLMHALMMKRFSLVDTLLVRGAKANVRTENNFTALTIAATFAPKNIIEKLLKYGSKESIGLKTNLQLYPLRPYELGKYSTCTFRNKVYSAIQTAFIHRNQDAIIALFENGAEFENLTLKVDPCQPYGTQVEIKIPLFYAVVTDMPKVVKYIMKRLNGEVITNDFGYNFLTYIISYNKFSYLDLIKDFSKYENMEAKNGNYPVHALAYHFVEIENINKLSNKGMDLNRLNRKGLSPFLIAAQLGENARLRELAKSSLVNKNIKAPTGESALMFAAATGSVDLVSYLIKSGANVNVVNNNGASPLLVSALYGRAETLKLLIGKGANLNQQLSGLDSCDKDSIVTSGYYLKNGRADTCNGDTPLIIAVKNREEGMIVSLLKAGANKKIKNSIGKTAYKYAKSARYYRRLLRKY